ncbi:MAG: dephospho-CoA kinase, partial [Desulfovibrionaceae bacterium]|nr:dephospho-CoA kinase [Desulfovibrionaceae bacterium]
MDTWTPDEVWERGAGPDDAGLRLDRFWGRELAGLGVSRQRVKQWIGLGLARVDGRVCLEADLNLVGGERLVLVAGPALAAAGPEQGEVDLVHADEDLLVVDKPAGLTTHPAPSQPENTLAQRLAGRFPGLARMDAWRPGIVHRLDKDTSGLLVVALNEAARLRLARDFELRRVSKAYLAVVLGRPDPDRGLIDAPIARHPRIRTRMAVSARDGREARSAYRVLWTDPGSRASLLMVRIFTGRTHQIRVHLAHLGHPLLGDAVYGGPENRRFRERFPGPGGLARRQMLHAFRLAFRHPATGRDMDFFAPPPEDFTALVAALERSCLRVAVIGAAGSGKSALLACLAEQGQAVFSADQCVARAYAAGGDGALLLERRFGSRFLDREGGVDRAALFKAMAGDP